MGNNIQPRRDTNFLLWRVKVPHWLQVNLLAGYAYSLISLLLTRPALLLVVVAGGFAFIGLIVGPLRRYAGQGTDADDRAEVNAAPTKKDALGIAWDHARTYQLWHLAILVVLTIGVLLDAYGVPTP